MRALIVLVLGCLPVACNSVAQDKELGFVNSEARVGLGHQWWLLGNMMIEAYVVNRALVLPTFTLSAAHNFGKPIVTQMDEYIDVKNVTCGGHLMSIRKSFTHNPAEVPWNTNLHYEHNSAQAIAKNLKGTESNYPVEKIYPETRSISCTMHVAQQHVDIARAIRDKYFGRESFIFIHARRGDKRWAYDCTTGERMHEVIASIGQKPMPRNVFLATNERDLTVFQELKNHYNLIVAQTLPEIYQLRQTDNYKAYLVELCMQRLAVIVINTFKESGGYYLCRNKTKHGPSRVR